MEQLYRCSFCKKFIGSKEEVTKHEENCLYNPALKTCYSCYYYDDIQESVCRNKKNNFVVVSEWEALQEHGCHTPRY